MQESRLQLDLLQGSLFVGAVAVDRIQPGDPQRGEAFAYRIKSTRGNTVTIII
jgi:hypothetical protein